MWLVALIVGVVVVLVLVVALTVVSVTTETEEGVEPSEQSAFPVEGQAVSLPSST